MHFESPKCVKMFIAPPGLCTWTFLGEEKWEKISDEKSGRKRKIKVERMENGEKVGATYGKVASWC